MDTKKHTLSMIERKRLVITGVKEVFSFDEQEIELEIFEEGYMFLQGIDLHIVKMNVDTGELVVEGLISQIAYEEVTTKKKSSVFGFFNK
ncbi:sporulation protein [Candidatus Epulonipiscium fishelsonii]|uniref:Sporulation protein n=1 Tax=Candidatus Epulonipiscium fishelsonii TaxID=77094 RepID=A0ACC8X9P9_9FIRM|nr:sporulation protein [Epulopiscium sp. SCG-B05WGA-EpuloA1]ONI38810.1 sporulation protein [Epulopiscium sp. SCG-B11WGA-EpuloA1]ONI47454.1 sporulation protein [Epulopiscium sp. SCG-C06WGA-EpuloA1]